MVRGERRQWRHARASKVKVMAALYKNIHPVKYYRDYLAQDVRPDGRGLLEFRPVAINVGTISTAEGSAIVKIGNTTIVCGVKAELCTPKAEEPDRGFIVANVELPALCSPRLRPGPPSDEQQVYSGFMERLIATSRVVDTRQLCICTDKLAWVLYCDFICLSHDGAVLDACVLTMAAALKTVTLPEVEYNPDTQAISVNELVRKPLELSSYPVATTFSIFDENILLADPNEEEERYGTGVIMVMMQDGKMSSIHKPGGSPVTQDQLQTCFSKAKEHTNHLQELVRTAFNASPER